MTAMKRTLLICTLLMASGASAQELFERYYPFAEAVDTQGGIVDVQGNLVMVGTTEGDIVVLRLQPDGEPIWMRKYPIFTEEGLYGPAITSTSEGIFVAGFTMGMGTGSRDGVLLHIDFDGSLISAKRYDQVGQSNAFHWVTPTEDGFIVSGRNSGSSSGYDMSLTGFDASGVMQWNRSYGSNDWDWGYQAIPLASGGYAMVGYGDGLVSQTCAYVVRIAPDGTEQWARSIHSTAADEGYALTEDAQGNIYVGGRTLGMGVTPPGVSAFITKLSPTGAHVWTRVLPNAIEVIGLQYVAGSGVVWLARPQNVAGGFGHYDIGWGVMSTDGDAAISRIYGDAGIDNVNTMVPAPGGGWYLMGSTNSQPEGWALHVMRIDAQGEGSCRGADWELAWQPFTPNVLPFTSVVESGLNAANVNMTTTEISISALNPCCAVDPAFTATQSSSDPYTWTFTAPPVVGTHGWDLGDGTTSTTASTTHTFTGNGSYQVCHSLTIDCGTATACQTISLAVGVGEAAAVPVRIYPVPASAEVRIETGSTMPTGVRLFDAQGRVIDHLRMERAGNSVVLNVSDLAAGSYWAEVGFGDKSVVRAPLVVAH